MRKKAIMLGLVAVLCLSAMGCDKRQEVLPPSSLPEISSTPAVSEVSEAAPSQIESLPEPVPVASIPEKEAEPSAPNIVAGNGALADYDTAGVQWGPGTQMDKQNRPVACVNLQEKYGKEGAYFIGTGENSIYLTFDLGYEAGYTASILDTLKEKKVTALFFVTMDYVNSEPAIVQRIIDEGHILGNHSYRHKDMTTLTKEEMEIEVQTLHDKIQNDYDYTMWLFRPPAGTFSPYSLETVHRLSYLNVFWSFAYHDWDRDAQPDQASSLLKLTDRLHSGGLYLLHAVSSTNDAILGDFIDQTRAKGYTFERFTLPDPAATE